MEKVNHYNRTKHKDFLMGPSVKFALAIIDSFSQKKMGLKYELSAGLLRGGGGGVAGPLREAPRKENPCSTGILP